MLSRSRHLLSCSVVVGILVNAERPCAAEQVGENRTMSETEMANLRAGARVGYGFKLIVIGSDPRTIEKTPGEWFLLAAADDGQDGYVPERFAKLVENAPTPTPTATELAATEDWDAAVQRYAAMHDDYFGKLHSILSWWTTLIWSAGPEADARRARVFPRMQQDATGFPDPSGQGPFGPCDERARRLLLGEET